MKSNHLPSSTYSAVVALVLSLGATQPSCDTDETVAPSASETPLSSATRISAAMTNDAAQAAGELISVYKALGDGDVSSAVEHFPSDISWSSFGADQHAVSGRDELRELWNGAAARKVALARVFVSDTDTLISQGVIVESSRSTEFVIICSIVDKQIVAVREFVPSTVDAGALARLPETVEIIEGDSDELNKVTAETLYASWGRHDWGSINGIIAEDVLFHDMSNGSATRGRAAYRDALESWAGGFPDLSVEIRDSWAVGDYVIIERRTRGTNSAKLGESPATNNVIELDALDIYRFEETSIAEIWEYSDGARYKRQISATQT